MVDLPTDRTEFLEEDLLGMFCSLSLDVAGYLTALSERQWLIVSNIHFHDLTLRKLSLSGRNKLHVILTQHRSKVDSRSCSFFFWIRLIDLIVATQSELPVKLLLFLLEFFHSWFYSHCLGVPFTNLVRIRFFTLFKHLSSHGLPLWLAPFQFLLLLLCNVVVF